MDAWNKFLEEIRNAQQELGANDPLWYRGLPRVEYKLVPTLFRFSNGEAFEQILFEKFNQARAKNITGKTDWDIVVEMQHYSIPTRLLDWTEVLGVAIYFACSKNDGDGYIWVLNPTRLNKSRLNQGIINLSEAGTEHEYKATYWRGEKNKPDHAIASSAYFYNDRVASQRGNFTVHVSNTPLEDEAKEFLRKVKLPREAMKSAREFLLHAGINEFRIFPDIVGLAPYLQDIVGLRKDTPSQHQNLVINSAQYGASGKYINVTDILSGKVADGELHIVANNDLFTDPNPNVFKELIVSYAVNEKNETITIPENSVLHLSFKKLVNSE